MSTTSAITPTRAHWIYAALILLGAIILLPFSAHAQYRGQYSYTQDGSASTTQYIYQSRGNSALQQKINELPSSADVRVTIPILFGVLTSDLTRNFGDPRDGGARTHEGLDIMSPSDTPIVSPTDAVVIRTGVGGSEGNYVYTANPGGETFVYMHLSQIGEGISPGTMLKRGDLIGYVGNTGNASGGAAHLHFEIHVGSRNATDPFERLAQSFSPAEQAASLTQIFSIATNPQVLASTLVTNFRSELSQIRAQGLFLPSILESTFTAANAPRIPASGVPDGTITIGANGTEVVNLQLFLIANSKGRAGSNLTSAGATGYFGPITQAALAEYQTAVGILPADGIYNASTRAFLGIASTPAPSPTAPSLDNTVASQLLAQVSALQAQLSLLTNNSTQTAFTRDLSLGSTGTDVLALQKYLNARGFTVALSGAGSIGNETQYFGPATQSALIKFQIFKSISPSVGYFGPITRAEVV